MYRESGVSPSCGAGVRRGRIIADIMDIESLAALSRVWAFNGRARAKRGDAGRELLQAGVSALLTSCCPGYVGIWVMCCYSQLWDCDGGGLLGGLDDRGITSSVGLMVRSEGRVRVVVTALRKQSF